MESKYNHQAYIKKIADKMENKALSMLNKGKLIMDEAKELLMQAKEMKKILKP